MARLETPCLRNLDDPLKLMGLLSLQSCGGLFILFTLSVLVDFFWGWWGTLFGRWSFAFDLAVVVAGGVVLALVERHRDQYYVASAVRYCCARRWRVVYSPLCPDSFAGESLENLFRGC